MVPIDETVELLYIEAVFTLPVTTPAEAQMSDRLPVKFTADARHRFLMLMRLTGQLQKAAHDVGISPTTVRELVKKDADFAAALAEAKEDFKEAVEREVLRRAVMGWEEPVYQQGLLAGTVRKYDSNLLAMLIKKLDPSYKEKSTVDVNLTGGILAAPVVDTEDDWRKRNAVEAEFEDTVDELEEQDEAAP